MIRGSSQTSVAAAIGSAALPALALAGTAQLARRPGVARWEERAFRLANSSVGPMERPLWWTMQFGNGLVAVVAPAALGSRGRRPADCARVGVAAFGAWQLAKGVKALVARPRPAALLDDVALRDGDPDGRGFVSGHATVAMTVATTAAPLVSDRDRALLLVAAGVVAFARVHVGAHLPLDVVGGLALGAVWARLVEAVR